MKTFVLAIWCIVVGYSRAQTLVLTQAAYEPVVGDSSFYHVLDTSAYSSGLPNSVSGPNATWNFSSLVSTSAKANALYLHPSAVPGASAYPTSNLVQKQGAVFNYFKSVTSPTPQTELLGINSSGISLTFTNSAIIAKFPVSYGNSFTDNISGTFNFSLSGVFTGSTNMQADGSGTLILPGGQVLTNVLRVKSVQTINLLLGILPFGVARQTVYNYFHGSQKFPVLNLTYSSLIVTGSTTPSLSAVVTGNSKSILVGLAENQVMYSTLDLYPNPTGDQLHIPIRDLRGQAMVQIVDAKGREVYTEQRVFQPNTEESISLEGLPDGLYFLRLQTESQLLHGKFFRQSP